MTIFTALLITLIVWAISMIRSIRWRALIYSLPLPITLVLVTAPVHIDGSQLLGIVALSLFITVVAITHTRLCWPILLADAAGIAAYIGLSLLIASFETIPFWPVLIAITALWGTATLLRPPLREDVTAPAPGARPGAAIKLGAVFSASLLMVALGNLLKGLIVTFPYSGVLVVIETRDHLTAFDRHFTRNSISLAAYFTGYYLLQEHAQPLALAGGWSAFAGCLLALHLSRANRPEQSERRAGPQ
jgi:hypothetical protein